MVGLYFSGTGNTKYCVEQFMQHYDKNGMPVLAEQGGVKSAVAMSIEEETIAKVLEAQDFIVFGYPIYYSALPKIVADFLDKHKNLFFGKKVFLIATQGAFSGDGTGCAARKLKKFGAKIIGGIHLKMPDSIADVKFVKKSLAKNKKLVARALEKIDQTVKKFDAGKPPRQGLGFFSHLLGLFGQRLWKRSKLKRYQDYPYIDSDKCIKCGKCAALCPMKNLVLCDDRLLHGSNCTMCYRCANHCPRGALTILGLEVYDQPLLEKFI